MGWVLSGPTGVAEREESTVSLTNAHTLRVEGIKYKNLDSTLRSFRESESLGIEEVANDPETNQFTSTLQVERMEDLKYHDDLMDNYSLSRRRLYGLLK